MTLFSLKIQSGDLFPALELVIFSKALKQAIALRAPAKLIASTDSQEQRKRILPTYVIVAWLILVNSWLNHHQREQAQTG